MLKAISRLFWFCIATLCDWLKILSPLSQGDVEALLRPHTIGRENTTKTTIARNPKNSCEIVASDSCEAPAFSSNYMQNQNHVTCYIYLLRVLIGSLDCLRLL